VFGSPAAARVIGQRDRLAGLLPASIAERLAGNAAPDAAVAVEKPGRVVETDVAPPLTQMAETPQPAVTPPAPAGMTPELTLAKPEPITPLASEAPAAPSGALVLNFRQDSWVEIKRADNTTVVARVMRAGSTESFDLAGPVSLTVGNARGVEAKVRGEPLNLAGTTRNNVARVTVK